MPPCHAIDITPLFRRFRRHYCFRHFLRCHGAISPPLRFADIDAGQRRFRHYCRQILLSLLLSAFASPCFRHYASRWLLPLILPAGISPFAADGHWFSFAFAAASDAIFLLPLFSHIIAAPMRHAAIAADAAADAAVDTYDIVCCCFHAFAAILMPLIAAYVDAADAAIICRAAISLR